MTYPTPIFGESSAQERISPTREKRVNPERTSPLRENCKIGSTIKKAVRFDDMARTEQPPNRKLNFDDDEYGRRGGSPMRQPSPRRSSPIRPSYTP